MLFLASVSLLNFRSRETKVWKLDENIDFFLNFIQIIIKN